VTVQVLSNPGCIKYVNLPMAYLRRVELLMELPSEGYGMVLIMWDHTVLLAPRLKWTHRAVFYHVMLYKWLFCHSCVCLFM